MPIKFSQIVNELIPVEIKLDGDDIINLTIRRNFYTPASAARVKTADDQMAAQVDLMASAITSWDVLDDNGQAMPVLVETLESFPIALLNAIYIAMLGAISPNATKADS